MTTAPGLAIGAGHRSGTTGTVVVDGRWRRHGTWVGLLQCWHVHRGQPGAAHRRPRRRADLRSPAAQRRRQDHRSPRVDDQHRGEGLRWHHDRNSLSAGSPFVAVHVLARGGVLLDTRQRRRRQDHRLHRAEVVATALVATQRTGDVFTPTSRRTARRGRSLRPGRSI